MRYSRRCERRDSLLRSRFFWCAGLVSLPLLVTSAGCAHQASVASQSRIPDVTTVSVASPIRRSIHYVVQQPGRIDPFEQTPIYTKIPGFVRSVCVDIGDRVKKGDLLVQLDVPELVEAHVAKTALVKQAQLGVTQAERSVEMVDASLATNQAEIEVAQAAQDRANASFQRWDSERQRMERLVQDKVVDVQSRDEMRNQSRSADAARKEAAARIRGAQASLAETRARLAKTKVDLDAARNQLTVAQAQERESGAMVAYSRLVAPYDGVISARQVHTGHFLNAATGGTKGEPLLVIVRTDKVRVFAEVPEADAVRVTAGEPSRIRVQTLNDREFQGKVAGTSWALDPSQRTLRTEIDFSNPEGILRPGMYVHSLIEVQHPNTWVVPASAILVRDQLTFCYQIVDGKTRRLPVRLGLRDGQFVEIMKVESPSPKPGMPPTWGDPTGKEKVIVSKPGELIENQEVHQADS